MSRLHHVRSRVRSHVRMVPAGTEEARQVELDHLIPEKGFCHECECFVDEPAGKLHRPTCKAEPARRRSA